MLRKGFVSKRLGSPYRFRPIRSIGSRSNPAAPCALKEQLARVVFEATIAKKPAGRFMIRSRTRVVKRHPEVDW